METFYNSTTKLPQRESSGPKRRNRIYDIEGDATTDTPMAPQRQGAPPAQELLIFLPDDAELLPLDPDAEGISAVTLRNKLTDRLVGQKEAVEAVVEVCQAYHVGTVTPGRPVGNFLFLGPTGTGKTHLVETVAESLRPGDNQALIKIDCAEFQHSHEIAKLVGSPPGYLGHRETHPMFSQERLNAGKSHDNILSFVLFDEIEKASDALWKLLLGILDKGTLTLGDNRMVTFEKSMIFMTSNVGARQIEEALSPRFGFGGAANKATDLKTMGEAAVRRKFSPEFVNRLEHVVVFDPLTKAQMYQILDLEMARMRGILIGAGCLAELDLAPDVKDLLVERGFDRRYGARHLQRTVKKLLVRPLTNLIASGQLKDAARVVVGRAGEKLTFSKFAVPEFKAA